jgi:cytochrome c-type biogenesis protein CcmF
MLVAGWLVAYLTVTGALPKWLPMGGGVVPTTTYDAIARPVGIVYLALLAFGPMLSWRKTDGPTLWKRLRIPLAAAAVIFVALVAEWKLVLKPIYDLMVTQATLAGQKFVGAGPAWYYNGLALLGFLVASILFANMMWLFIDGALKRAEARGENFFSALWSILTKARNQSGGYIAHIGMAVILVGLIGSAMFVQDQTYAVSSMPGSSFDMGGYTFTLQGSATPPQDNGDVKQVITIQVSRGARQLGTVQPSFTTMTTKQTKQDAGVISEPLKDVFVVFQGMSDRSAVVNVKINPLIWFSWGGFILLLLGTALAAWPKRATGELAVAGRGRRKAA